MASIPGWAFAGAGGAIALYSKYIQEKHPSGAMTLFFWIGILLLVVGAFKFVARYLMGAKDLEERVPRDVGAVRDGIFACPRCNAKLHPQSRYCNWCGTRQ